MVVAQPELPPPPGVTISAASFLPWLRKMGLLATWPGTRQRPGQEQPLTLVSAPQPEIRWPCSI